MHPFFYTHVEIEEAEGRWWLLVEPANNAGSMMDSDLPHAWYETIANPPGILLIARQLGNQRLILQRGSDNNSDAQEGDWWKSPKGVK
jgi:hypothetical protein